ncbi:hypothetical protein GGF32_009720 [Allomyces javanicus]|nr:hypothetical protein GGF32_009720 [Allomyces javanicus]
MADAQQLLASWIPNDDGMDVPGRGRRETDSPVSEYHDDQYNPQADRTYINDPDLRGVFPGAQRSRDDRIAAQPAPLPTEHGAKGAAERPSAWQIEPEKVHLTHPRWNSGIDALKNEIAARLGCEGRPLTMQLDRCVLCDPGNHVVWHQAAAESRGLVFATYAELDVQENGTGVLKGVDRARYMALHAANALLPLADRFVFYLAACCRAVPHDTPGRMLSESRTFYYIADWYRIADATGACTKVPNIILCRDKFPLDDMAATVNPDDLTFSGYWIHAPSWSETRTRYDGKEVTETFYERCMLVAFPADSELKTVRKYLGPDAAVAMVDAMLDRPDDLELVLDVTRVLGAHTKRDLAWGKALLARVASVGHVAGIRVVLDQWPNLLRADDAVLCGLITSALWPQVAADAVTRFRRVGAHDGIALCLRAATAVLNKLPKARRTDLIRGIIAAYRSKEDLNRDPAFGAGHSAARAQAQHEDGRALIDLAMRAVTGWSPLVRDLVPIARTVYAELAATPQVAPSAPRPPAGYPGDTEIDAFLRSDALEATIKGRFGGIADARAYASRHGGSPFFSTAAGGIGKRAFVALKRKAANAHDKNVLRRREAEETMRKYVEFFGEEVAVGVGA